jgi:hypothetical protein
VWKRYWLLFYLLLIFFLLRSGFGNGYVRRQFSTANDPETIFSRSGRLLFSEADLFSLELIPGISDIAALALISKRDEIISEARFLSEEERWRAFTLAKGIGDKKAVELSKYFALVPKAPTE